jgi:hypothetical protein
VCVVVIEYMDVKVSAHPDKTKPWQVHLGSCYSCSFRCFISKEIRISKGNA